METKSSNELNLASSTVIEIPLTASSSASCIVTAAKPSTMDSRRKRVREEMGLPFARKLSFGRYGRSAIESSEVILGILTRSRWENGNEYLALYKDALNDYGVLKLFESNEYSDAIDMVKNAVRKNLTIVEESLNPTMFLNRTMKDLLYYNQDFHDFCYQYSALSSKVTNEIDAITTIVGQVERIENDSAIIVLHPDDVSPYIEEIPSNMLTTFGLQAGDGFIKKELNWSPETSVRYFQPAKIEYLDKVSNIEERLQDAEVPFTAARYN